jgi:pimeloyl-ACP methyl ester carboxylesterase
MGGRIAMELGMDHPDRVRAIACLCPAAAFSHRPAVALVRALRPELGIVASRLPRSRILPQMRGLFADPSCVEPEWYEAAVDDFLHVWKSPRARMAFFASLRNIYLDEPEGDRGFWTRLATMGVPSLYIYGRRDALISHRFARKVQRTLPGADVVVWSDCGHVPQIEFPDRTARSLEKFFTRHLSKRASA